MREERGAESPVLRREDAEYREVGVHERSQARDEFHKWQVEQAGAPRGCEALGGCIVRRELGVSARARLDPRVQLLAVILAVKPRIASMQQEQHVIGSATGLHRLGTAEYAQYAEPIGLESVV